MTKTIQSFLLVLLLLQTGLGFTQEPNGNINLALLPEAILSGSVSSGRGTPIAILYDPSINDHANPTNYNEYGVSYGVNLGVVDVDNGFEWKVEWPTSKNINYITFGGVYPNQPQPNTAWRISYLSGSSWIVIDEGIGGWIDSGIFEWDNTLAQPISAKAIRVQLFSDGSNDLVHIHLRARGGNSTVQASDSSTSPKACLIQLLPYDDSSSSNNSVWSEANSVASYTGKVGIGTNDPGDYELAVNGEIRTKEVKVETANWPDYVFQKDYRLPSLEEIQNYINEKGHLPNIPSAREAEANGIELGEMNKLLLEKIEELTLYMIQQEHKINKQTEEIFYLKDLKNRIMELEKLTSKL